VTEYLDGYQYQDAVLEFFSTAEGYVKNTVISGTNNYNYVFQYKDHLGNIRISYTVDPSDGVLKILDETHYYPFGLKHNGYSATQQMIKGAAGGTVAIVPVVNSGDVTFKYRYSGKEEQDELGLNMYDFGARNYDAAIGRWMNMDPLAEKYYSKTTYNYCANNPMYFIDPDGRSMWAAGMGGSTAGQVTTESDWGKNDMFGRERFNQHGMYIAPNDRSQASAELGEMPGFTDSMDDESAEINPNRQLAQYIVATFKYGDVQVIKEWLDKHPFTETDGIIQFKGIKELSLNINTSLGVKDLTNWAGNSAIDEVGGTILTRIFGKAGGYLLYDGGLAKSQTPILDREKRQIKIIRAQDSLINYLFRPQGPMQVPSMSNNMNPYSGLSRFQVNYWYR
jgi:RHS repeat-associated protein